MYKIAMLMTVSVMLLGMTISHCRAQQIAIAQAMNGQKC